MKDREKLLADGYVVVPNAIPPELLDWLRGRVQSLLPLQEKELDTMSATLASGVSETLEAFADKILRRLGFANFRSIGPTLINKKPFEQRRPWHHDWRWAHLELTKEREPTQVGVVFYMRPTSRENGCLRVWPGSHLLDCAIRPEPLSDIPEETDVPTVLGDVVLFDARTRHATHANTTAEPRESVNMWYLTRDFDIDQPYSWQV